MSGEDLRISMSALDALGLGSPVTVTVDGVERRGLVWADEHGGEAIFENPEGDTWVTDYLGDRLADHVRGRVEIHGPTDEQRREHLRREREGGV